MNPESRDSGFDASHRPGMTGRQFSDPRAEYSGSVSNAARCRRDCMTNAPACPMAAASRPIVQAATLSPAGLAAGQNRRRSSGRRCRVCSRRNPHRTCTRKSRSALPWKPAAGPCRNIRSLVEVAAPWSSRHWGIVVNYRKFNARCECRISLDSDAQGNALTCCHSGMRPPNSGLPEFGNIIVQVGNSRLGWRRLGIHNHDGG